MNHGLSCRAPRPEDVLLALRPRFVTTKELLNDVWGPAYRTEFEYVRVYMRRLRTKLNSLGLPDAIESRSGLGYRLTVTE